jgi:hypothetical protein
MHALRSRDAPAPWLLGMQVRGRHPCWTRAVAAVQTRLFML